MTRKEEIDNASYEYTGEYTNSDFHFDAEWVDEHPEVKDPYEQCIQYSSIEDGIKAHAETYSFNIESELFNQLTKEQQKLWREEIEQACISGGEVGVELARDMRYKENLEVKEVDLEKEIKCFTMSKELFEADSVIKAVAKHFFELGIKAQKGE